MPLNYCRCVCSTSVVLVGILNLIAKVYLRKHASPHIKRYVLILYSNQQSTFSRLVPGSLKNGRLAGFLQVVWLKNLLWLPVPTNNALPQIYLKKKVTTLLATLIYITFMSVSNMYWIFGPIKLEKFPFHGKIQVL